MYVFAQVLGNPAQMQDRNGVIAPGEASSPGIFLHGMEELFMSKRLLRAGLTASLLFVAEQLSHLAGAKPPDLPAKHQIVCNEQTPQTTTPSGSITIGVG